LCTTFYFHSECIHLQFYQLGISCLPHQIPLSHRTPIHRNKNRPQLESWVLHRILYPMQYDYENQNFGRMGSIFIPLEKLSTYSLAHSLPELQRALHWSTSINQNFHPTPTTTQWDLPVTGERSVTTSRIGGWWLLLWALHNRTLTQPRCPR
jgi:hypothetical protein